MLRRISLMVLQVIGLALVLVVSSLVPASAQESWAVYMYVCGSDLETEYGAATDNLEELMKVSLPENVTFFVQTGGAKKWQLKGVPNKAIGRYVYDSKGWRELMTLPDASMGARGTLTEFLSFAGEHFPADHRMVIFWDHGGGSLGGFCSDEKSDETLSLGDLRYALENSLGKNPAQPPLEMVCFDTCLMATLDTVNALQGYSKYLVASQELMPGCGTDYRTWAGALAANPALGGRELGQIICDSYMDRCRKFESADMATLSLLDLSKLPALNAAYERLGEEALQSAKSAPRDFFVGFDRAAGSVENYGPNRAEEGSWTDMVDMGSLAAETALPGGEALQSALRDVVAYKVTGPYRRYGNGLSCYYSLDGDREMLKAYCGLPGASPAFGRLYSQMLTPDKGGNFLFDYDLSKLDNKSVDTEGESVVLRLSPEEVNAISEVECLLSWEKDGRPLVLGTDDKVDKNWEQGIFRDTFEGEWPRLCGHVIPMDMEEAHPDYYLYYSLIYLNGKKHYLFSAYDMGKKAFEIMGAYRILSNGQLDRVVTQLQQGDEVVPVFYDYDGREVKGEKFRISEKPYIADEPLPAGNYNFFFRIKAPRHEPVLTEGMPIRVN